MTAGNHPALSGSPRLPSRFVLLALLPLFALLPPETRGESLAGCALLIGGLALARRDGGAGRLAIDALLVALAAVAAVTAFRGVAPAAAVGPMSAVILALGVGVAARPGHDDELHRKLLAVLVVVATVVALHALYQRAWGLERLALLVESDPSFPDREAILTRLGRGRAFAFFATPAALGGYLALTVPVAVALASAAKGRMRWVWGGTVAAGAGAFLAAASATATGALLVAVGLAALIWSRSRRALGVGALALLLLLAGVVWLRGDRITDPGHGEGPWRLRAGNFRAAAAMAVDRPFSGVGPGGFAESYPAYRTAGDNETRHAHHLPLELMAEWGWPAGTALSLAFFVIFLSPLWRERRDAPPWRRGLAVGLAAFALQNLADFTALMPSLLWTAALLRGRLAEAPVDGPRGRETAGGRTLAGGALALLLLATVAAGLGGLSANARIAGRAEAFAGATERAHTLARRAARLAPWDADAAELLARLTTDAALRDPSDEGLLARAATAADQAVDLAPTRASARETRARLRLATGDAPGAYADLAEAARLYPRHERYPVSRDRLREELAKGRGGERP